MPNLDERVALLEGRVQEQAASMADIRASGAELRQEFRALREEMRQFREEMRQEIRDLRRDMDRRFAWVVGIMVTGFVAMIGTFAGAFWSLLQIVQSRTL